MQNVPFVDFVNKLRLVIEKQVEDLNTKDHIITQIAKANANEACKRVILNLPFNPPPTLNQIIYACTTLVPINQQNLKTRENVVGTANATESTASQEKRNANWTCHRCGKLEHLG